MSRAQVLFYNVSIYSNDTILLYFDPPSTALLTEILHTAYDLAMQNCEETVLL